MIGPPSPTMSHQVLARKWRPRTFQTLMGQDHVVRALDHALSNDRLHHAYLFTGTRGVGKTTIARLLARAVNCEVGVSATPCGQCAACRGIEQGSFVDYLELDAASNRGVDEMAQLLDNAVYAPTVGRYKVYVIDEVHMLTNFAFNAMLKTLEEPPPHILFILATTDPQKVPVTVLSRCMQFNLRNLRPDTIAAHLDTVLRAEAIDFDAGALNLLGKAAAGSMRDALSLLDQAISFGAGEVREPAVAEMLGTVDADHIERVFTALAAGDGPALIAIADEVADRSAAADALLGELAQAVSRMAMAASAVNPDPQDPAVVAASRFSAEDLQVFYQILLYGRRDLPLAPDVRAGLMMTLLRMLAFVPAHPDGDHDRGADGHGRPVAPVREPRARPPGQTADPIGEVAQANRPPLSVDRPAGPTQRAGPVTGGVSSGASDVAPAAPAPGASLSPVAAARAALAARNPKGTAARAAAPDVARVSPRMQPVPCGPADPDPPPPDEPQLHGLADAEPRSEVGTVISAGPADDPKRRDAAPRSFDGDWPALATRLGLSGRAGQFLRQSELLDHAGDRFSVRVPIAPLADDSVLSAVGAALSDHLGRPVRLEAVVGRVEGFTAARRDDEARALRLAQAEQIIAADPFVRDLLDEFDAQILPGSVRAIDTSQDQGDTHA